MMFVRSFIFNVAFIGTTALISLLGTLLVPAPPRIMRKVQTLWGRVVFWLLKVIVGTDYQVRGRENFPSQPAIFVCKHQSAWDTLIFFLLNTNTVYVVKEELLKIPFFGWLVRRAGSISVDRKAGLSALKSLIADTQARLDEGLNVVIFPEGTRSKVGEVGTYHPGVAALYKNVDAPMHMVALNSGVFWSRRSFLKRRGTVLFEMLPQVPKGMDRRTFMDHIKTEIEGHSRALENESSPPTSPTMDSAATESNP